MSGSFPRAGRCFTVGFVCIAVVAACSGDGDIGDPASAEPTATATQDAASQVEEEIAAIFGRFWDAVIQAQSGQSEDPAALFEGITTEATLQYNVGVAQRYEEQGIIRVGEPVISEVTVQVVSDSGVVSACVDESNWLAQVDGETLPPQEEQLKPHPVVYEVVNSDGGWLIGDPIEPGGTITC